MSATVVFTRPAHNYTLNGCEGEKKSSWKVERSPRRSSGLRAPYKGSALHMTLHSMTFYHSMTVSFVLYIFEHWLKAFPASFEEIDLVMERWEWHRIAIYTLRSTISASCAFSHSFWEQSGAPNKTSLCGRWMELWRAFSITTFHLLPMDGHDFYLLKTAPLIPLLSPLFIHYKCRQTWGCSVVAHWHFCKTQAASLTDAVGQVWTKMSYYIRQIVPSKLLDWTRGIPCMLI